MMMLLLIWGLLQRLLIAAIGIGIGLVTFIPNAMLCDSGTSVAGFVAMIGMMASILFIIGGIFGAIIFPSHWTYYCLLPGISFEFLALFILPNVLYPFHEKQLAEKDKDSNGSYQKQQLSTQEFIQIRRAARSKRLYAHSM